MRKKLIGSILVSSLLLCNSMSVFAGTVSTEGEHEVTVEGEIISTFEVVLPSSVALKSGQSSVDFDITVTSNTHIGDEEVLSIVPEDVIYLVKNDDEEDLVQALVYQDKKKFIGTELGETDVTTVCTVETGNLESGVYRGSLKFDIRLTGDTAILVDGTPRSWNWLVYNDYFDISEDGVLSKGTSDLSSLSGVLNISNKVKTIDTKAFAGSGIDTIVLSPSVEKINDAAFMSADYLTSIEVADGNSNFSSKDGVLFNSDGTKLLAYPSGNPATDYKIASTVTEIGNYAFAYCTNIASLTIPDTVTKTGQGSFTDMCVVTSKYDVKSNLSDITYNHDYLSSDTGSILMAKKVNGYTTFYYDALLSGKKYNYLASGTGYIKETESKRVLSIAATMIDAHNKKLGYFNTSSSYITALNSTISNYTYGKIPAYDDSIYSSLINNSEYSYIYYAYYDNRDSEYRLASNTYDGSFSANYTDIFYSELDIYDSNNNLLYKADITK